MNVSKVITNQMRHTQTGTPYYAAPEVWKEQPYDQMSDIWSLGCILYEMTCLNTPFKAKNMKQLYNQIIKSQYTPPSKQYSDTLINMINSLLC